MRAHVVVIFIASVDADRCAALPQTHVTDAKRRLLLLHATGTATTPASSF